MASRIDVAKRVINGTFGSLLLDGLSRADIKAGQIRVEKENTPIPLAGNIVIDTKLTGVKVKVSVTLYHVDSVCAEEIRETMKGHDVRHVAIMGLEDPDAWGFERVAARNIAWDELSAADWKLNTMGEITLTGSATEVEFLDEIPVE